MAFKFSWETHSSHQLDDNNSVTGQQQFGHSGQVANQQHRNSWFHTAAGDAKCITNSQKMHRKNISRALEDEGRRLPTLDSMVPSLFSNPSTPSGGATIDGNRILRMRRQITNRSPTHRGPQEPLTLEASGSPKDRSSRGETHRRSGGVAGAHGGGEGLFFLGDEKHEVVTCYRILPL